MPLFDASGTIQAPTPKRTMFLATESGRLYSVDFSENPQLDDPGLVDWNLSISKMLVGKFQLSRTRAVTLDEIEIICINDGSKDNSLELLLEAASKDHRISVYTQKNSGLSVTRNRGAELANGKYIYFMDSDDILDKNALYKLFFRAEKRFA